MKNVSISPGAGWAIIAVLVAAAAAGFWYFTSPSPGKVDVSKYTRGEIEDEDPPKRGQPGYRERITDPPQ